MPRDAERVSVLFNEPKLLKFLVGVGSSSRSKVSVLFNEPKLLKSGDAQQARPANVRFSALQRAEIAEIRPPLPAPPVSQIPIPARRRS